MIYYFDIPTSYAKIWGGEKISPLGVSPKWVKNKKKKLGKNNGQLPSATTGGARKPPGPIKICLLNKQMINR